MSRMIGLGIVVVLPLMVVAYWAGHAMLELSARSAHNTGASIGDEQLDDIFGRHRARSAHNAGASVGGPNPARPTATGGTEMLSWIIGIGIVVVPLVIVGYCAATVVLAKPMAIRDGKKDVDLFLGFVRLHLWEQNEGLVFLKNKRISNVIYGSDPEMGGGSVFIFPLFGEEMRVRVSLTHRLSVFADSNALTRESVRIRAKVAFWWKIVNLEKYFYFVDEEVGALTDQGAAVQQSGRGRSVYGFAKQQDRQLDAAERWLQTLVESTLRAQVSKSAVADLVSKHPTQYLQARGDVLPAGTQLLQSNTVGSDDLITSLVAELNNEIAPKAAEYGLCVERFEFQELRLSDEAQKAIDEVWNASLLPAKTEMEARAKQIELQRLKEVLGHDAVVATEVLKSFQGGFLGGLPAGLNALLGNLGSSGASARPALGFSHEAAPGPIPRELPAVETPAQQQQPLPSAVRCSACKHDFELQPGHNGPHATCPHCGTVLQVS